MAEKAAITLILQINGVGPNDRNALTEKVDLIDQIQKEHHENNHLA
jgi:hypothetical protein